MAVAWLAASNYIVNGCRQRQVHLFLGFHLLLLLYYTTCSGIVVVYVHVHMHIHMDDIHVYMTYCNSKRAFCIYTATEGM